MKNDKVFFSSSAKFDVVVSELTSRDWSPSLEYSASVSLSWTNLKTVCFDSISGDQMINHLKGSQHLSNKSLFAYNFESFYPNNSILPLNWSSAFQDLGELISKILLNSIYCCTKKIASKSSLESKYISAIQDYRAILRLLRMDSDVSSLEDVKFGAQILDCFTFDLTIDFPRLSSVLQLLEKFQPWRLQWGGLNDLWIVKPVGLSCGEQIEVVCGIHAVITSVERLEYKCVVQKYIEKPLLIRNPLSSVNSQPTRKFDIRQWILVTALDPLIVYGFSECYLRLSSREYSLETDLLSDPKVHLCNHAIQKQQNGGEGDQASVNDKGNEYSDSTAPDDIPCDTMLTQSAFNQQLVELNLPQWVNSECPYDDFVQPKVKMACIAAVNSCRSRLKRVGRGFEWLGLDLMVVLNHIEHSNDSVAFADNVASVLLLEVNVSPDVSLSTPVTSRLVRPAVTDLFTLILDEDALDWTPSLVVRSPETTAVGPPRSTPTRRSSESPHWELWYNSNNSQDCCDLQNAIGKHKRVVSINSRSNNVFRGLNGSVDHTPRKLDLLCAVRDCFRKGLVDPGGEGVEGEEDDDEM